MRPRPMATSAPPTFYLDDPPAGPGARVRIGGEEGRHGRVLRVGAGDPCFGVDGRGGRWYLRVVAVSEREVEVEAEGPPEREPAPGEPRAALPWIELAVSWPRKNRAAGMLGALVQLGCAALTPLDAQHRGAEPCPDLEAPRWSRVAREALKQCRRTWMPRFGAPLTPEELAAQRPGARIAMLHPSAGMSFDTWLRSLQPGSVGTPGRPILLAIGPEGGFASSERDALLTAGATTVWLGPHVMRIETAACAAMALAGCTLGSPLGGWDAQVPSRSPK